MSPSHAAHCVARYLLILLLGAGLGSASLTAQPDSAPERVRTEIPYQDGKAILLSDFQERTSKTRYRASGHVEITFQDMVITTDEAEYDEATRKGLALGNTRFSQKRQWLTCSRAEFDFGNQTGVFYDAQGFTDQEFFVRGRTILKTGPDTYKVQEGFITACREPKPNWAFSSADTNIHVDHTARLHGVGFRVKGVPVFYLPYLIVPMEAKKRSSGFVPFHTGNSSSKGRVFSEGYYQTLGPSADLTLYGDYFTLRGTAWGGILRARPNPQTRLYFQAYGIQDKLNQGGAQLVVDGESLLKNDFRAVARVNITTSFNFRQAFADTFKSATVPQEEAVVFLTRNHESLSTNFSFQREEVLFPVRSVVIRKAPSLEFYSLGTPLWNSPFVFYLRAGLEGLARTDSLIQTPPLVQRLDFFPRVAVRVPEFAGFSVTPSVGIRETYYSARITDAPQPQLVTQGLNRHYGEFEVDLRTPTFERDFQSSWFGSFKHVIEPTVVYRRIFGIDRERETIRFDDQDAIADTNEVEFGLVNRFFKTRETAPGMQQNFEFMSVSLLQKYYFDPSFGGSFRPGEPNMFFPLDTLTGFSLTGTESNLAPVSMITRLSPKPGITHDIRADFDTKKGRLRDASISTIWQQHQLFIAGTYFKTEALEPGSFRAHQVQGQVGYGSTKSGLSASVTVSYNIQTAKLLNSQTRLNYMWDCCGVALEFQQFDLGLRTENRFSFSFTLKGIGSFGNIKRPESLF